MLYAVLNDIVSTAKAPSWISRFLGHGGRNRVMPILSLLYALCRQDHLQGQCETYFLSWVAFRCSGRWPIDNSFIWDAGLSARNMGLAKTHKSMEYLA